VSGTSSVGVLHAYSKQSSQSVKLRSLIERLHAAPILTRTPSPIPRRFTQLRAEQTAEMAAAYLGGVPVTELAKTYGIHRGSVSKHLRRHGIAPRPVGLDEQQITEAARLYEQGDSLATIGTRMGVTAHTVRSRLVERGVRMRSSYEHLL
jgi:DNA-directed RNA polymerase specialized sigma24 family protein